MSAGRLVRDGLVARVDALAEVAELRDGQGQRVLQLRLAGGWSLDVLPDRGLDLGGAWWAGQPIAWRSPVAVDPGPGRDWEDRFLGGLLVTCGTENIGPARDGHGLHGEYSLTPASQVGWSRTVDDDRVSVTVRGRVESTRLSGRHIVVEREISAATDSGEVRVLDVIRNLGPHPEPVPLLYHVNLGAPLVVPGTAVDVAATGTVSREPEVPITGAFEFPAPGADARPAVFEHRDVPGLAAVRNPDGLVVEVAWSQQSLPRLFQWVYPRTGRWVLGVEPANAPLFGVERDAPNAGAPLLAPGGRWDTEVRITVR